MNRTISVTVLGLAALVMACSPATQQPAASQSAPSAPAAQRTLTMAIRLEPVSLSLRPPKETFSNVDHTRIFNADFHYLVNVLEYDLVNSLHLHGNLFNWYPTGTSRQASELTDTVMLCQGQRGIAEWRFPHPGRFMFHAHQSEFTELGWQGFFEVS